MGKRVSKNGKKKKEKGEQIEAFEKKRKRKRKRPFDNNTLDTLRIAANTRHIMIIVFSREYVLSVIRWESSIIPPVLTMPSLRSIPRRIDMSIV